MIVIQENLLNTPFQFVAHQVNCRGVMGAGVAKGLAQKYPNLLNSYREYIQEVHEFNKENNVIPDTVLGKVFIYLDNSDGKCILNIFGQEGYGRDKCYTDYEAVINGFREAILFIRQDYCEDWTQIPIAIPYGMGCGLAGGDWNKMKEILEEIEHEYNVLFIAHKI